MKPAVSTAAGDDPPKPHPLVALADWVFAFPIAFFTEIGTIAKLLAETVFWGVRPPYRFRLFASAMEFVGVQSIFIVGLTGTFVGMVFGLQLVDGFRQFGAENQTGGVVAIALARELAPVFASLMIASRAGSAMCTELGSMRVTEQIDALTTMAVNPVQYLIVPRVVAGVTMVPALTMVFNAVGIFGAWFVCVQVLGLDAGVFISRARYLVDPADVTQGLIKSFVFGLAITIIACRQGFYASGGAAGVGQATTRAVVLSVVSILILDYFITTMLTDDSEVL